MNVYELHMRVGSVDPIQSVQIGEHKSLRSGGGARADYKVCSTHDMKFAMIPYVALFSGSNSVEAIVLPARGPEHSEYSIRFQRAKKGWWVDVWRQREWEVITAGKCSGAVEFLR